MKLVTLAGAGVFLLVVAAIAVVAAPEVRGQVLRERPAVHFRTLLHGGSAIGVELRDVDEADVRREQLPALSGAVVVEVAGSSPAADAGFRAGDVVVTFDQERVRSARHLSRLIDETPAGREVTATVIRAGERLEMTVAPRAAGVADALGREWRAFGGSVEVPRSLDFFRGREVPAVIARPRARLGVTTSELTDQLGEYFGATGGGVLVASVTDDTPASRAGLRAGDVITRVEEDAVRTAVQLQRRLNEASGEVELTIVRDRQERTLTVTLEPRDTRRLVPRTAVRK
jgi:S1-C subfamily serine protease